MATTLDSADATTAVALIRATIADDAEAQASILNTTDPVDLLAAVSSLLVVLGTQALGGLDMLDQTLETWQANYQCRGGQV